MHMEKCTFPPLITTEAITFFSIKEEKSSCKVFFPPSISSNVGHIFRCSYTTSECCIKQSLCITTWHDGEMASQQSRGKWSVVVTTNSNLLWLLHKTRCGFSCFVLLEVPSFTSSFSSSLFSLIPRFCFLLVSEKEGDRDVAHLHARHYGDMEILNVNNNDFFFPPLLLNLEVWVLS